MTAVREAIVLPCLFLTVALLGGLRVAQDVRLVEPPLVSLVLALLLIAALIRARAVRPDRLMSQRRTALENVNGGVLLLTLFTATAQVFTLLIPDHGLLNVLVSVFFGVQILTTLAAVREREAMLRSVTVLLGCAFVLRFIALESLYSPGRGLMKRVMTALMEGITLGALDYQPTGAVTGYVAFVALAVYLLGLLLIGAESRRDEIEGLPAVRTVPTTLVVKALLLPIVWSMTACADDRPANTAAPPPLVSHAERNARLATARVWMPPEIPVGRANLAENPESSLSFRASDEVTCRFVAQEVHGTTPKFNCELPGGQVVKIKYGTRNPELFAEVAATRLLAALGFGADRMYLVDKVHCRGCPRLPFQAMQCHIRTGLTTACFAGGLDYDRSLTFSPAVIEQPIDGAKIEAVERQGWAWYELDAVDAEKGGSPRAHVDAIKLMAMVLAHWDNKAENQRLICRTAAGGGCDPVLALMQDLGATFGPAKVDLLNWRRVPVWKDPRTCTVSMETLPAGGATYPEQRISEEGRIFLLGLLDQLTPAQLNDLFSSAGIVRTRSIPAESRDAGAWVRAFTDKVRQIREAGPCPSA